MTTKYDIKNIYLLTIWIDTIIHSWTPEERLYLDLELLQNDPTKTRCVVSDGHREHIREYKCDDKFNFDDPLFEGIDDADWGIY